MAEIIEFPNKHEAESRRSKKMAKITELPNRSEEILVPIEALQELSEEFKDRMYENDDSLRHTFNMLFGGEGDSLFEVIRNELIGGEQD